MAKISKCRVEVKSWERENAENFIFKYQLVPNNGWLHIQLRKYSYHRQVIRFQQMVSADLYKENLKF